MNTKSIALVTAFGLLLAASSALASPRVWKDASSGRTLTGEFVELTKNAVKVRRANGDVVSLPLSRLTEEDIAFAKGASDKGGALANDWPSWRGTWTSTAAWRRASAGASGWGFGLGFRAGGVWGRRESGGTVACIVLMQ